MQHKIRVTTSLFEHTQVKRHFTNPCCFGEDFAKWLLRELASLRTAGFEFSEPIQEDYGWGVWGSRGQDSFWIALSYCSDGPTEQPAEWMVSVNYEPGLNVIKRLIHKPDRQAFGQLRDQVWQSLTSNRAIEVIP